MQGHGAVHTQAELQLDVRGAAGAGDQGEGGGQRVEPTQVSEHGREIGLQA